MKYNRYFGMFMVSETSFMQRVWKIRQQTLFGFMLKCLWWQRSNEVIILKTFPQRSKFLAVFSCHKNFILKKRRKTNVMHFWKTVTKTDKWSWKKRLSFIKYLGHKLKLGTFETILIEERVSFLSFHNLAQSDGNIWGDAKADSYGNWKWWLMICRRVWKVSLACNKLSKWARPNSSH